MMGGQVPASSFVAMGMTEPDGTDFYKNAGHDSSYPGYYNVAEDAYESNVAEAIEILKKYYTWDENEQKFTNFPTLTYLYNTSEAHKAIGEYLQAALASVGITLNLENQEWNTFLNTRKDGNYSIARNGWVADYNDPICFLDMWVTNSGNNDAQYGRDAHGALKMYNLDLTDLGYDIKVENGRISAVNVNPTKFYILANGYAAYADSSKITVIPTGDTASSSRIATSESTFQQSSGSRLKSYRAISRVGSSAWWSLTLSLFISRFMSGVIFCAS